MSNEFGYLFDASEKKILNQIKEYRPENFMIIQDSEFTRKSVERRYKGRFNIFSCGIEKRNYSFICKFDQTGEEYNAKEILKKIKKTLIITGLGLYGELFIKELRMYEKIEGVPLEKRIPIVIFGSPKIEKIEKIKNLIDFYIDNLDIEALKKLDAFFSEAL